MPEVLAGVLATPGLIWIVMAALVAGCVYGFAGFGAALIFMPIATAFVTPEVAVAAFAVSALASLVTVYPKAWVNCDRRASVLMITAALITAPLGVWVLRTANDLWLRWAVVAVVTITLIALLAGWRYRSTPNTATRAAVGGATGFVGGATGLNGPVIVLFNLAGQDPVARVRANNIIFLTTNSLLLLPIMALQGVLPMTSVLIGLTLLIPYGCGAWLGQRLFNPNQQHIYRGVAYTIIAAAIIIGLPIYQ
ncbi:sulfite exporter TauE/SafE family protein [Pseudaestuariivita rosea]|uniref:sulfite exporter TauE/SafE family protein n=1 Tax=Pseudaestuariivita rosea TaxID=2763263 RepID=UPI001ABA67DD|nr:sulfite exporter TauE/SafE family protein [Pseudaestuariivita rosea]